VGSGQGCPLLSPAFSSIFLVFPFSLSSFPCRSFALFLFFSFPRKLADYFTKSSPPYHPLWGERVIVTPYYSPFLVSPSTQEELGGPQRWDMPGLPYGLTPPTSQKNLTMVPPQQVCRPLPFSLLSPPFCHQRVKRGRRSSPPGKVARNRAVRGYWC
jgi:hypothetical protein